jgi:hypothetical protein
MGIYKLAKTISAASKSLSLMRAGVFAGLLMSKAD